MKPLRASWNSSGTTAYMVRDWAWMRSIPTVDKTNSFNHRTLPEPRSSSKKPLSVRLSPRDLIESALEEFLLSILILAFVPWRPAVAFRMAGVNYLPMECSKCRVAHSCPKKGSSPLTLPGNKKALCSLVGGYGRTPVRQEILGEESREASAKNGPCLTIAEVPRLDEDSGLLIYELEKIFSQPVLHERETVSDHISMMVPKSPS